MKFDIIYWKFTKCLDS